MDFPKTQPNVALLDGLFTDGDPTVPTPPSRDPASWANDVTTSILNVQTDGSLVAQEGDPTQLQKALKRRYGGNVTAITVTGALSDDMAGLVLINAAAGNIVATLPPAADGPWPFRFIRIDNSANTVTVAGAGDDTIGGNASVFLAGQYSALSVRSDSVASWWEGASPVRFSSYPGNPNTHVPGGALAGAIPPDLCWDSTDAILYLCTTSGNAAGAVWTAVAPQAATVKTITPTPFEASGNYAPRPGLLYCMVELQSDGGGGGGSGPTNGAAGAGGGGGPFARKIFTGAQIAAALVGGVIPITLGLGGTGGNNAGGNGTNGSGASFGTLLVAPGGNGGNGSNSSTVPSIPGALQAAPAADFSRAGSFGGFGQPNLWGGWGGDSMMGAGADANATDGGSNGNGPAGFGAGAGGACTGNGGVGRVGGQGGAAYCLVTEWCSE